MRLPSRATALLLLALSLTGSAEPAPQDAQALQAAADQGRPDAQFQLARACLRGEGVPKDPDKAYQLMKAAADQGNAEAIGGLGYFHSVGLVVPKDDKQAAEWFRKGAEKGSAKAALNYGKLLVDEKAGTPNTSGENRELGLQWIRKAADRNLPEAAFSYGLILYYGDHGVTRDEKCAAPYLTVAANNCMADAQNILGVMTEGGKGVPKDVAASRNWFRKAALQGHARAQCNLGRSLSPFDKQKPTRIEAMAWLLLSEEQGDTVAIKTLQDYKPRLAPAELEEAAGKAAELGKLVPAKE